MSSLVQIITESTLPTEETGMIYKTRRGQTEIVKQVGNRFYYFDRMMGRWMPIKKDKVEFTDKHKVNESSTGLLSFDDILFEAVIDESFDSKPSVLGSYVKRVIKTDADIKKSEIYTRQIGDKTYLILKINGKDVFYTEFSDIEKINKSKDTFVKASKDLLNKFKADSKLDFIDADKAKFDVEKYFTAGKVEL